MNNHRFGYTGVVMTTYFLYTGIGWIWLEADSGYLPVTHHILYGISTYARRAQIVWQHLLGGVAALMIK